MDEYGTELTFPLLDELARASARGRVSASEFLSSRNVGRVGPLLELLLLHRGGTLPLNALPCCPTRQALSGALSLTNATRGIYGTSDATAFGFITTGRNADTLDPDAELRWVAFRQKAQQAAELSLPKPTAQGLMGAMTEIEENIHLHSERPQDGVVAFRGSAEEFEFVVADSGVGTLASLRRSPDYASLDDAGKALRLALQDGTSRLSHEEPNRGYGFRNLFRNLANMNGELRFRSDDQAVTIEGVGPELVKSTLRQKTPLQGFAASIVCRPHSTCQRDA
jgi:anti-sigma regulatory factor (Ser/Thr protein kinase)